MNFFGLGEDKKEQGNLDRFGLLGFMQWRVAASEGFRYVRYDDGQKESFFDHGSVWGLEGEAPSFCSSEVQFWTQKTSLEKVVALLDQFTPGPVRLQGPALPSCPTVVTSFCRVQQSRPALSRSGLGVVDKLKNM